MHFLVHFKLSVAKRFLRLDMESVVQVEGQNSRIC